MRGLIRVPLVIVLTLFSAMVIAQNTITKRFDDVESITLDTSSGDGIVRKGSGSQVKVTVEHTYDDEIYTPVMEQFGGRLKIREKFSRYSSGWGHSVWTLEIPDGIELKFSTGSGNQQVDNLNIDLRLRSGSGNATLNKVKGDIEVNGGSGEVIISNAEGNFDLNEGSGDMEIDHFKGEMRANTGSGQLTIAKSSGKFRLNVGSDGINLREVSGSMRVNVGSGDIDARGIELTGASTFNSGSGDTNVELASALIHDISINSGSGNATLDFDGNEISGDIEMRAHSRNGRIKAPFKFQREYFDQDTMVKEVRLGNSDNSITISTGSGTARITK